MLHILVGFYLPTTFLSSLFQQVCTHFKPSLLHNLSMVVLFKYAFLVQLVIESLRTSAILLNGFTVFTICIHILGIWSPYNLSFIGCFVEFMYTIINHFKPLRSFYDCFYKSMHFLYKITSHKLQYFHLDSTVYHLSPFSQPYHVAQQALS